VAFVDLLGYRFLAEQMGSHQTFVEVLRRSLKESFDHLVPSHGGWTGKPLPWLMKTFTDNIVLGYPIVIREGEAELGIVLGRFASFQIEMTLAGFFLRGAVAVGDLYMDENIVYGPALLEAYEAERSAARDPRIILAQSATLAMNTHMHRFQEVRRSAQHNEVLRDADGQLFVNYLYDVVQFEADMGYPTTDFLERHRRIVSERLRAFIAQPRIWSKYYWAACYHNFFCAERPDFAEYAINLGEFAPGPVRLSDDSPGDA
jgi:hypothetical protein